MAVGLHGNRHTCVARKVDQRRRIVSVDKVDDRPHGLIDREIPRGSGGVEAGVAAQQNTAAHRRP